jgi:hypothetical protein
MISEAARESAKAVEEHRKERTFVFAWRVCPHCGGPVRAPWWFFSPYTQILRCKPCGEEWVWSVFDPPSVFEDPA